MISSPKYISRCGMVTPYDVIDLGLHWLTQWLVASRHYPNQY